MSTKRFSQLTGIFFIAGAVSVNIPYVLLILNFGYPEILRAPIDQILTKYQAGGSTLLVTWLAFAWVGIPMLFGALMLKRVLENENSLFLETATTIGVIGYIVQLIGLLRWFFCCPHNHSSLPKSSIVQHFERIPFPVVLGHSSIWRSRNG